jgi:hypothetical protein
MTRYSAYSTELVLYAVAFVLGILTLTTTTLWSALALSLATVFVGCCANGVTAAYFPRRRTR